MDSTEVAVAIIGPIATGLVAATGVLIQQWSLARDLEMRRRRQIGFAHDQLAAVQLLHSMRDTRSNPGELSRKIDYIIDAAMEGILQAQSMQQSSRRIREHNLRRELWLIGIIRTGPGKIARAFYYASFIWTSYLIIGTVTALGYTSSFDVFVTFIFSAAILGAVPVFILRRITISIDQRRRAAILNKRRRTGHPPHVPVRPPPFMQQQPPNPHPGLYPPPGPPAWRADPRNG
ncbi:hypothetical protein [Nocardia arthritidis]|uniref:hypothetical protein n=1 Tax=Nocardia arthritidis TaxID=228602 RepID=UPI000B200E8E|nr:hypothetical protein [Nocardia arthritidis]